MTKPATSEVGQKLIAAIVAAAEKNPEKIITMCTYFTGEQESCPSCIVGVGLADSGLVTDFESFIDMKNSNGDSINFDRFEFWCFDFDSLSGITRQEVEWITEIQCCQDRQWTWINSLREADMIYGESIGRGKK